MRAEDRMSEGLPRRRKEPCSPRSRRRPHRQHCNERTPSLLVPRSRPNDARLSLRPSHPNRSEMRRKRRSREVKSADLPQAGRPTRKKDSDERKREEPGRIADAQADPLPPRCGRRPRPRRHGSRFVQLLSGRSNVVRQIVRRRVSACADRLRRKQRLDAEKSVLFVSCRLSLCPPPVFSGSLSGLFRQRLIWFPQVHVS